ncbi:50S ribosomal protein L4 [Mycetocola spongiae]|uniref:50S ribosomal protein L4 n=1 Tax=Mycetocola spongiae TaxID=2859226 RepID=UPI001CF0E508|nr:50S ribosomal protein L4 [Mycetocola spongiae]UCR88568.1 50S ribosomal protein L4 [Mycetocola spongiae]
MATKIDVLDVKGKKAGAVELPAELFDVETNVPLIHQVVVAQLAAARQGTHSTKNRGERSGAGRKPFKQKGTGRARQGSIRAPQMVGGGIVHGPTPRDYSQRTPKKMIAAALRGALSDRARGERLHIVESLSLGETPSTKAAATYLDTIASTRHVLVVLERNDEISERSIRNIPEVHVITQDQLNAYDVLISDDIVFTKAAIEAFIAAKSAKGTEEVSA